MKPDSVLITVSRRHAMRVRSRIVFFLLRRALRRIAARTGRPVARGRRAGIATLAAHHS